MNIEWRIDDTGGLRYATARITGQSRFVWAQIEQRGDLIGFSSGGDIGQEVVHAAVEILRRYTETGKIWAPEPAPELDLPCLHCGKPVRVKYDSLEAQGVLVPFCNDGVCEDMFAAGL